MKSLPPKALLFDLGGVLLDIDFGRAIEAWSRLSALPATELQRLFSFDDAYERHERGQITAQEYFAHLCSALQLSGKPEDVEAGWNAIFVREIEQTRRLVEKARQKFPCFAFTNTNASHMGCWSAAYPEVVGAFDRIFASYQMGLRKPERAAFDHICQALALGPASILFFDDLPANVEAARNAGLQAVLVRGPQDVAEALHSAGVL